MCFLDATLYPLAAGPDADHARKVADNLIVRSAFGSHQTFAFSHLHALTSPAAGSPAAALLDRVAVDTLSQCIPLVWVPVWAFSFADSFASSLVPIDELQSAGLVDEHVQLRPDLWAWPRSKNPIYKMIATLSSQPVRTLRELAPKYSDEQMRRSVAAGTASRQAVPQCYERVVLCQFRSTFDPYEPPMAPWRAGQRVAESALSKRPVSVSRAIAASDAIARHARELRVLFVNRTRTKFSRSLSNMGYLLRQCNQGSRRWQPPGWKIICRAHEFGATGLEHDIRAARRADVLVGTHGAGLANAFFMRRGAALVEVRPYHFEGPWPDKYFRSWSALEQSVHYYQVTSGSPELSVPRPESNVTVWDARDHAVRLPWRTLREVLAAIISVGASREAYVRLLWAQGTVFTSFAKQQ